MSSSPLVTYTKLSPNRTKPRDHKIDTVTIHCTGGQGTAQTILNMSHFTTYDPDDGSSCNYAVGKDGSIGLCVEESNRSWCSSSRTNDHRAITIEVSSDSKHPYAVTDGAYKALINLLVDICRRNDIPRLVWSANKTDRVNHKKGCNMTVHRDFAAKACPGDYLYNLHGQIAAEVNERLNPKEEEEVTQEQFNQMMGVYLSQVRARPVSGYAKEAWDKAVALGIFDGTNPQGSFTREQAATVLLERLGLLPKPEVS